jgi:hypothetical protein
MYHTHLILGEPHEPKTLICAHHTYNLNGRAMVVQMFDYTVEKQGKDGAFKPCKRYNEEAVKDRIKAHLFVHGVDSFQTEKY